MLPRGMVDEQTFDENLNWKSFESRMIVGVNSSFCYLMVSLFIQYTALLDCLKEFETSVDLTPGRYTCMLQPCDVGMMWSFKSGTKKFYRNWATNTYKNFSSDASLPVTDWKDIISWVLTVWEVIGCNYTRSIFKHIGFDPSDTAIPPAPYPATSFPYFDDSQSNGEDRVRLADSV